jgi:acylphosphatase
VASRRFLVSGRVQGVSFRAATRQRARELGIDGHARNLDDGRVEVVASASDGLLAQLESFLWRGPIYARVDAVDVEDVDVTPAPGFRIG